MQSTYSNAPVSNSNPVVQTPLTGFKFSTIGQSPSLLERMSDTRVPSRPPLSDLHPSQEQNSASYAHLRPALSRPLTMDTPLVERESARSVKPVLTLHSNTFGPAPTSSLSSFEPPNDPQPFDQIRASVLPDLQYPNATPEIETPPEEFSTAYLPMDQDGPHSSLPAPRNLPPVFDSGAPRIETGVADGTADGSSLSLPSSLSQHSDMTTSAEPEQVRKPVEHLFRLASAREERLSKQREIFDLRSGELSTFSAEASRAVRDLQDKSESFKQQAEEMRAQAEQTLQEANKMRDMADRLIASAGALDVDMLSAKDDVARTVDRSEQMTRFVRKSFDWLASLRLREQEKIALVQAEIAEQESAERTRRQQELYQQLERRKIEAAKREEELEAARKRAEEEREAARRRSYEMRRAEVMADKWRTTEAHVQSIQTERKITDASGSGSGSGSSVRGSKAPPTTSPGLNRELSHTSTSANLSPSPQAVHAPSRSSVAPEITPSLSQPPPSSNKVKTTPLHVSFVPAQTEVGRAVNTDSPLSSTTLASELQAHNVVQTSYHPRPNQVARDLTQEQMQSQKPGQLAPTLEPHRVVIKREPSVELSTARLQPSLDIINNDQSQHRQPVAAVRSTNQERSKDQHAPTSSISGSRATSLHVAQTEDYRCRSDSSGAVPPQHDLRHPQDSLRAHVVPSIDGQGYRRQDSVSRDRSPPRWNDRGRRSPSPPWREPPSRSPSRSPPSVRKRPRSRSPLRYEARPAVDHWEPERSRARRGRIEEHRPWQHRDSGYDRVRHGDNSRRYRGPPPRRTFSNNYQPSLSPSPPPSPRHFHDDRSPPRRSYRGRLPSAEHDPQRYANIDVREDRMEYQPNINVRHHEPAAYEGAKPSLPAEEEPRGQYQQRQRLTPVSERDQTSTPSPRQGEVEIGLLDRINMSEADDRGRGRGRPLPGIARGGPNARRGMRGAFGSGRGRGGVSGSTPVLLSRMSETTPRPTRMAFAPSLSDRMEQD